MSSVTTERLFGRRPERGDLEDWVRIFTDPRVDEELWPAELRTADKVRAMLESSIAHWERWEFGPWTVIERASDRIVGRVGLEHTTKFGRPEVELEWFVDPDVWGRGYALRDPTGTERTPGDSNSSGEKRFRSSHQAAGGLTSHPVG